MYKIIISIVGSLIAACIGGMFTYYSVDRHLKLEKKEKQDVAVAIARNFLIEEIEKNYNIILNSPPELIKILKKEIDKTITIPYFIYYYDEFDRIKYDIVKYNVQEVLDIINIYRTFRLLQNNKGKDYREFKEEEKEFIKNGIIKCENMIKSSQGLFSM
jgi:hypothetical protein